MSQFWCLLTGGQSSAVVDGLLARDAPIRALVRDPASAGGRRLADLGVDVVAGSLGDRTSLFAAMSGVSGVFALTTPFEAGTDAESA
jgi:uncharacterized protein YbjT (DUF2867 family)